MINHAVASIRKFVFAAGALALLHASPTFANETAQIAKLVQARDYTAALEKADAQLAAGSADPQVRFLKGLALSGLERRDEAIALFSKLSSDYPSLPEPYNNLAVLHAAAGDYAKARVALENAVRVNPDYARAHENLGDVYAQLANQSYGAMLKLEPDNTEVRGKLAHVRAAITARGTTAGAASTASAAAKPASTQPAVTGERAEVLAALNDWASAWSARDTDAYLAFYSPGFNTPGGQPRDAWEAERRARIEDKAFIEVEVQSPVIALDEGRARASFDQRYASDRYADTDRKTLIWEKRNGKWQILREESGR